MKCPHCGNKLFYEDSIRTEYFGNSYYDTSYQTCEHCKKGFFVEEKYDLTESWISEEQDEEDEED